MNIDRYKLTFCAMSTEWPRFYKLQNVFQRTFY